MLLYKKPMLYDRRCRPVTVKRKIKVISLLVDPD